MFIGLPRSENMPIESLAGLNCNLWQGRKKKLQLKAKKWDLPKLKLRIIIHNPCFSFDTLKLEETKDQNGKKTSEARSMMQWKL